MFKSCIKVAVALGVLFIGAISTSASVSEFDGETYKGLTISELSKMIVKEPSTFTILDEETKHYSIDFPVEILIDDELFKEDVKLITAKYWLGDEEDEINNFYLRALTLKVYGTQYYENLVNKEELKDEYKSNDGFHYESSMPSINIEDIYFYDGEEYCKPCESDVSVRILENGENIVLHFKAILRNPAELKDYPRIPEYVKDANNRYVAKDPRYTARHASAIYDLFDAKCLELEEDGSLSPDKSITKKQFANMLVKYLGLKAENGIFTDGFNPDETITYDELISIAKYVIVTNNAKTPLVNCYGMEKVEVGSEEYRNDASQIIVDLECYDLDASNADALVSKVDAIYVISRLKIELDSEEEYVGSSPYAIMRPYSDYYR